MFLTVFYGILDPRTGWLTYCNAGHNPPCILRVEDRQIQTLSRTGMALGTMPGVSWEQRAIHLARGDMLVLYADGVTDAHNEGGAVFGQERLLDVVQANPGRPAHEVRDSLPRAVQRFTGESSQFHDITLVIAVRDA